MAKRMIKCPCIFTLAILLTCVTSTLAVPALRGVKKTITLADGTRVVAELKGDENANYYRTSEGRALQQINGVYQYINLDSLKRLGNKRLAERNKARMARSHKVSNIYTGKRKGLVILVNQTDIKFTYPLSEWNNYFNQVGYSKDGMGGSVHDYFLEQSYGNFDLEFDVIGPIEASHNSVYYAANSGYYVPDLVEEVCKQIDDKINFKDYDWDGDGYVDQVYVVYAGYGSAQGAENTIWPHEWKLSSSHLGASYSTADGVKIDTYACSCELHGDGVKDKGKIDGIGTACHEFSHCLGLPDFYDTNESNWGMDVWSLMDYGNYNGGYGYVPCGYTSYERWYAGWLDPIELTSAQRISDMPNLHDSPTAYIIYNQANKNEFYMLENRQKVGFDSEMYGHGMLVLHVDYDSKAWHDNTVNISAGHQRMTVVVADGQYGTSGSNGDGDPFPGADNVTELTNTSSPAAATLYNANSDGTKFLNAPITDIDETNGLITFSFMGGNTSMPTPVATEATDINLTNATFNANWEKIDGAQSYTIKVTKIQEVSPWDCALFTEDFSGCYSQISGTSKDIGSILDTYCTNSGFTGEYCYRSPHNLRIGKTGTDGWIKTPTISGPKGTTLTYLIGLLGVNGTASVQMYVETEEGTNGSAKMSSVPSAASAPDGQYAYYCFQQDTWTFGDFSLKFSPADGSGNFYLGFIGAFDGNFVWDDFKESDFNVKGCVNWMDTESEDFHTPRKAQVVSEQGVYTTTDLTQNIKVLEPAIYIYKVRALTDKGNTVWSNEISVDMSDIQTGIQVPSNLTPNTNDAIFDLEGRHVTDPTHGIYIRNGKKFIVK